MANFMLLCLKFLIINIIVNNTTNHRFIRYKIHMLIVWYMYCSTIGMLEDNFVLRCYHFIFDGCYTNAIYSFHYNNYLFGYNNYILSIIKRNSILLGL